MYAVLDIETTGGKFDEEGITEIAVYKFNGTEVVDQMASLVNPERPIQPFVERLTGINQRMLQNAPRFFEIAKRIIEITEDCVIVAHNAEFDYRILRTEFRRLGYPYQREALCTVTLSKTLFPNQESYKLGRLVRDLGIPISDRHRAQGDAQATLKLFQLLLEKDTQKQIIQTQITAFADPQLPQVQHKILDSLPTDKGVYYIYNTKKELIYIGKSNNIRKRLLSHLTSKNSKSQKISAQLAQVSFEKTGSEAIALLKEQNEIKKNQPPLNRAAKQRLFPMGIRMETDTKGYLNLLVEQVSSDQTYLAVFKNKKASIQRLYQWIEKYQLCLNKTSLTNQKEHCTDYDLKKCEGACMQEEDSAHYNQKIERLTEDLRFPHTHFLITDYGRQKGEYSFILIENQQFKGYGFYELNHQIKTLDRIHSRLIPMENNPDCQALIHRLLYQKKYRKLIEITPH